jgi:3-isopropylmalate/(R)-2-methylmalate dehydratase large subunit
LKPTVSCPHTVDNTKTVDELPQNQDKSRVHRKLYKRKNRDLRIAAEILKRPKVHPDVRLLVIPASKDVFIEAIDEGLIKTLVEAGASIIARDAVLVSECILELLGDGEVCLSPKTGIFKAEWVIQQFYLPCLSATAAYSAITGVISDPREILK